MMVLVVSYPTVNQAITGGNASITGMETFDAADNLTYMGELTAFIHLMK